MLADLRFDRVGSLLVARVTGDVDMSNAGEVGVALDRIITNDVLGVALDLSAVDYFDSAGIHLAFDLRERLQVRGLGFRLVVPPGSAVRGSLKYAGVLHTLDVDDALDEALAALRAGPDL
jgi:anti-anti-sigma factor